MDGFEKDSMTGKKYPGKIQSEKACIFMYNKKCLFPHSLFQMT